MRLSAGRWAAVLAAAFLVTPSRAAAQQRAPGSGGTCRLEFINTPHTRQESIRNPVTGQYDSFFGGGVLAVCRAQDITIRSDSLEYYASDGRAYLIGSASYTEPRFNIAADRMTYYAGEERVIAFGTVRGSMPNGSTLVGPMAEYLRANPRLRPRSYMTATGRPTVTIAEQDPAVEPGPPVTVTANRLVMEGDSLMYGSGDVMIVRTEITATGDSVFLDSGKETMRLMRRPVIEGRRDRPFRLTGTVIDVYGRERALERIVARATAEAVSEDMTLNADTIDLRVADGLLQRAYAWTAPGARQRTRARAPNYLIIADSIAVDMPGQRIRDLYAHRSAVAESRPDTVRFQADTTDWLRGATIIAHFDTTPPRDTANASSPDLRTLVANEDARAFYHLAPTDTSLRKPAISYIRGRRITVQFAARELASVAVADSVSGVYLEPTREGAASAGGAGTRARPPARSPAPAGGRPAPSTPTASAGRQGQAGATEP